MGIAPVKLRNKKIYNSYHLYISFVNEKNFKDQDDPIEVWLSKDHEKIPLKVKGKLPIGSLEAEMTDIKNIDDIKE